MKKLIKLLIISSLVWGVQSLAATLTPEQQQAKQQGAILYQQGLCKKPIPLLEEAAKAGDSDSQYYLGDCLERLDSMITKQAVYWFEQAANQGDTYAMMRLGEEDKMCEVLKACGNRNTSEWRAKAKRLLTEQANQGNGEAMYQLFMMTRSLSWLEKSAEAGYPVAQYRLSIRYSEGHGLFLFSSRQAAVDKWMKAAADNNYPQAILLWSDRLVELNKKDDAEVYLLKSVDIGYIRGVYAYAVRSAYSEIYPGKKDSIGLKEDIPKSYGLLNLLAQIPDPHAQSSLKKLQDKVTPEQKKEGKAYAEQWQKTHPPLSNFREKYLYYVK